MDGTTALPVVDREAEEILGNVRLLRATISDHAANVEAARRVPDELFEQIRATGIFRLLQPKKFGGLTANPHYLLDALFDISRGCASTGWSTAICNVHQYMVSRFPERAQEDVWGENPAALVAGSYAPRCKATPVDGGYRVSGTGDFVSAIHNTDWCAVGMMVPGENEDDRLVPHFGLVPRTDYEIDDMWYASGLAGSGSCDLTVEDVFVPTHRLIPFSVMTTVSKTPGGLSHDAPLYTIPLMSISSYPLTSVALGAAQGAYDAYLESVTQRTVVGIGGVGGGSRLADLPTVQIRIGGAQAYIEAGRAVVKLEVDASLRTANSGEDHTEVDRVARRRGVAMSARLAKEAADMIYGGAGAKALLTSDPIQRAWRNARAAAQHRGLNWDIQMSNVGSHAVGMGNLGGY